MKTKLRYSVTYFQLRNVIDKHKRYVRRWKKVDKVYCLTKKSALKTARYYSQFRAEKVTIRREEV